MVERRNEAGLKVGKNQRHRGWVSMHSLALDKAVIFGEREIEKERDASAKEGDSQRKVPAAAVDCTLTVAKYRANQL